MGLVLGALYVLDICTHVTTVSSESKTSRVPSRTGSFDAHRAAVSAFSTGDKSPALDAPKGRDRLAMDLPTTTVAGTLHLGLAE